MDQFNNLNEMPIADLNETELNVLQSAEETMNRERESEVYLIAFRRQKD
jgi:hypothetical protein